MSKHHQLLRFSILLCWMLLTCGLGMLVQHTVAHAAAALPPGYSLTVTESASTMTYGGSAPTFQAQLTVPAGENPVSNPVLFNFKIDSQDYGPDRYTSSGDTYTFIMKGPTAPPLPAGQHTVVATYDSIPLQETLESAPITLTVQKYTPTVYCNANSSSTLAINASIGFTMSAENGPDIDWQDATYTITFIGSQTFTDTNLTTDSYGYGTAVAPPVPGSYKYRCTFNGTHNFNAAKSPLSGSTIVVSANHHPTIKLYSNPTTIKGGQTATLDIVVSGGPGLPAPTGKVSLYLANLFTKNINLGPGGSVEFQIAFPSPLPAKTLRVAYSGDPVYATSSASFTLTNPPIPGGSNPSNPNPTPKPTSTATPTPAGDSTPAPSSTLTAKQWNDRWARSNKLHFQPGEHDVLDRVAGTPDPGRWRKRGLHRATKTCKSGFNTCHADLSFQRG